MSREWEGVPVWGSPPTHGGEDEHGTLGAPSVKYCQSHRCEWGSGRRLGKRYKTNPGLKRPGIAKQNSLNLIPQSVQIQGRILSKGVWLGQKCHRWKYFIINPFASVRAHSRWVIVQLLRRKPENFSRHPSKLE